jgi:hypothetical protein
MFTSADLSSEKFCKVSKSLEVINMKLIVRTAVAALVITGAFASTQISSASSATKVSVARNSALPIPMCAPDDPNACGITRGR